MTSKAETLSFGRSKTEPDVVKCGHVAAGSRRRGHPAPPNTNIRRLEPESHTEILAPQARSNTLVISIA